MHKNNLTPLELNILQVAQIYKSFQYALLMHETMSATKEDKEKAIDNLISKGYFIYCSDFGLRLSKKGLQDSLTTDDIIENMQSQAKVNGLTEEILEDILKDN